MPSLYSGFFKRLANYSTDCMAGCFWPQLLVLSKNAPPPPPSVLVAQTALPTKSLFAGLPTEQALDNKNDPFVIKTTQCWLLTTCYTHLYMCSVVEKFWFSGCVSGGFHWRVIKFQFSRFSHNMIAIAR